MMCSMIWLKYDLKLHLTKTIQHVCVEHLTDRGSAVMKQPKYLH